MTDNGSIIASLPRVAAISTLASRLDTFQAVVTAILPQVDHLFVYLDGYRAPPSFLSGLDRVSVRRCEDLGNLHSSSRFLCLQHLTTPTVVAMVDDDILYPPDYIERLVDALRLADGGAIVGVHGRIFVPPHQSYVHHASMAHFAQELDQPRDVHELGTGTCAFVSDRLDVDPRGWARNDMNDIILATEAQRRGLPRIAVARAAGWLKSLAENQPDSQWVKTRLDDAEQSRRMRALLGLYV